METVKKFIKWAQNSGWKITLKNSNEENLPQIIIDKFHITDEYKIFLSYIERCTNAEENVWFLSVKDYLEAIPTMGSSKISSSDSEYVIKMKNYWAKHFPILFDKSSGSFEYYAINIDNKKILYGCEPEFEDSEIIANSFEIFLEKLMDKEILTL